MKIALNYAIRIEWKEPNLFRNIILRMPQLNAFLKIGLFVTKIGFLESIWDSRFSIEIDFDA